MKTDELKIERIEIVLGAMSEEVNRYWFELGFESVKSINQHRPQRKMV